MSTVVYKEISIEYALGRSCGDPVRRCQMSYRINRGGSR